MDLLSVFVASCATSCRAIFCGVMLLSALSADALPLFPGGNHAGEDHSNESHAGEDLGVGIILSGANLSGSDFSSVSMNGANLTGANLSGTNFAGAYLEAVFSGATITGETLFTDADLDSAVLSGLDLRNTTIGQASSLNSADFSNADLSGLDLSEVEFLEFGSLDGAQLIGTNLSGARLNQAIGANFSNAILVRATLDEDEIFNAIFRNADMRYVQFEVIAGNNDFSGADMRYSDIHLEHGSFRNANFANADLRSATLSIFEPGTGLYDGSNWTGAKICGTVFLDEVPDTTGAIGCSVPEPASLSLMALGIGGVAAWSMRRRVQGGKTGAASSSHQ